MRTILDADRRFTFTALGTAVTITTTADLTDTARRVLWGIFAEWQARTEASAASGGQNLTGLARAMAISEACELLDNEQPEGWMLQVGELQIVGGGIALGPDLAIAA